MSSAQMLVYMHGADIATRTRHALENGAEVEELPDMPAPASVEAARTRMGEHAYDYWLRRGLQDGAT